MAMWVCQRASPKSGNDLVVERVAALAYTNINVANSKDVKASVPSNTDNEAETGDDLSEPPQVADRPV